MGAGRIMAAATACWAVLATGIVAGGAESRLGGQAACTATFSSDESCTFPGTFNFDGGKGMLTVDLSGLPSGATIFRAELVLNPPRDGNRPAKPTRVCPADQPDTPLRFVGPRFVSLDALAAVQHAARNGKPLALNVETTAGGVARLEVSCLGGRPRAGNIPAVSDMKVSHRAGQSLITFAEPRLEEFGDFKTGAEVRAFARQLAEKHRGLTFRIWRGPERITAGTIARAELVGECGLMTAWNSTYHQYDTDRKEPVRYRVADGGEPVAWGTGIHAHNPPKAGKAFYAVSVAANGEEDLGNWTAGDTTAEAVDETVGLGAPVLQWKETPESWQYRSAAKGSHLTRLIYTRWESWPHSSAPSSPIDYLVAMAEDPPPAKLPPEPGQKAYKVEPAPVGLHLHCWGASLNGGYGWWHNAHRGAILIASNQIPYDWWTGYHEARGTCKTWGDGQVHPFTMNRLFGFVDWAATQWKLDRTRLFTAGTSMGGSGAPMFAIRHGDRVAWALGWVGVHVPEQSPQFAGSYRQCYGPEPAQTTMPDGKTRAWDYFSDVWYLRQFPNKETGFVIASNGKDDGGIGWPQAVAFARTLQETRRPHMFNWACQGHGTRTLIGANFDLDIRTDQTLPAFANCTLDGNIGTATRKTAEQLAAEKARQEEEKADGKRGEVRLDPFDGDPEGNYNGYLWWETQDIVDAADAWEMTVVLVDKAPKPDCRVDLTPRRLQRFRTPRGTRFAYTVADARTGNQTASGQAVADDLDLLTLKQLPLVKGKNRVRIVPAR